MKANLKHFIFIFSIVLFTSCKTNEVIINKDTIFKDFFEDNRNNWDLNNDYNDFTVNILNGNLNIEKHTRNRINNGCLWLSKKIEGFSTEKDFSIIFLAKILSYGDVSNGIDFQWGAINLPNQKLKLYQINISVEGDIYLDYMDNGWTRLSRKKFVSEIKSYREINGVEYSDQPYPLKIDNYNKYEIAQIGDSCLVYINDNKVYSEKINVVPGNCIGIQQCLKSSWQIDYLEIKQKK